MSSTFFSESDQTTVPAEVHPYRTMSRMAMLALIFGLLSTLGLLAPALVGFSVFGIISAAFSLLIINRHPHEYSGKGVALSGGILSAAMMATALTYHTIVYYTEVPAGYERISFKVLQSDDNYSPVPPEAVQLDGKKVFVGGYIHPDAGMAPVQSFVLVPDMGTCCFGGQPKLTDMIEVTLQGTDRVRYNTRKRKLAGTLRVAPELKPREKLQGTYYQLTVDKVVR